MKITTFSGNFVEKKKCRKIKDVYYEKDVDCFLMSDKKWHRINNGLIVRVTDDLKNHRYVLKGESADYLEVVTSVDVNFNPVTELVNKLYVSKLLSGTYGQPSAWDSTKSKMVKVVSYDLLRKISVFSPKIEKYILSYSYLKTYEKGLLFKDPFSEEAINVINSNADLKKIINVRKYQYSKEALMSSFLETSSLPYNVDKFGIKFRHNTKVSKADLNSTLTTKDISFAKMLKGTTVGIELEANSGLLPLDVLRDYSFFPLRDGSIDGVEYTSAILSGEEGIYKIKNMLNWSNMYLKKTNQESFHVHIKNKSLTKEFVVNMFLILSSIEEEIYDMFPKFTRRSSLYKRKGKDYNIMLPIVDVKKASSLSNVFEGIFNYFCGGSTRDYFGGFEKDARPHPADSGNDRKWNIASRYHWVNLIPTIFSKSGTVEFRLHSPTFNYEKVMYWILICNAIIKYAHNNTYVNILDLHLRKSISLKNILNSEYNLLYQTKIKNDLLKYISNRKAFYNKNLTKIQKSAVNSLIKSNNIDELHSNNAQILKSLYEVQSGIVEIKNDTTSCFK